MLVLHKVREKFPNLTFGLYRDDGLGVHKKLSGTNVERMKKSSIAVFKDMGLKITIETKLTVVDFLDTTLYIIHIS